MAFNKNLSDTFLLQDIKDEFTSIEGRLDNVETYDGRLDSLESFNSTIANFIHSPTSGILSGMMCHFLCTNPPLGYLERKGQILNRADYPALWTYAQNSGLVIPESQWSSGTETDKLKFSDGDGVNTFRIMDTRGMHIRDWDDGRGLDSGRAMGSYQADGVRSHSHNLSVALINHQGGGNNYVAYQNNSYNDGGIPTVSFGGSENTVKNAAYMGCIHV